MVGVSESKLREILRENNDDLVERLDDRYENKTEATKRDAALRTHVANNYFSREQGKAASWVIGVFVGIFTIGLNIYTSFKNGGN